MATVPFTQLRSLRSFSLGPGGGLGAFVALRPSLESNQNLAEILLLDLGSGKTRTLTAFPGVPDGPVWWDPGHLVYSVGRDVYAVDLDGRVEHWAHHDVAIRQLCAVPGKGYVLGATAAKAPDEGSPFVTSALPYKRDGQGRIHGRDHLVAVRSTGEVADLGPGSGPRVRPDGRAVAHLAEADSVEFLDAVLTVRDFDPETLTLGPERRQDLPRAVQAFAWSRDGQLAVLAHADTIGGASPARLLVGRPDSEFHDWTATNDLWVGMDGEGAGDWTFSPSRLTIEWVDESCVIALTQVRGAVRPIWVSRAGAEPVADVDGITSEAVWDAATGSLYAVLETPVHPHEIVRWDQAGHRTQVTDLNPFSFPEPEHFTVEGANGDPIDVFALFAGEGPGPTVFAIHGGPHGAFMRGIYLDHHRLREAGIHVVWSNPHGSTGQSVEFARSLTGQWGELDEQDWRRIRDHLEAAGHGATRLGVWGTSYGGYMSTWLAGHLENVSAAVIQAPVADQVSMIGSSDIGYTFTPRGLGYDSPVPQGVEDLDERMAKAWRNSPLRTYPRISAATLILVGDRDDRCPPSQAEELYTLLRQQSRSPVELVMYPGESHLIARHGRPRSRDDRQRRTTAWLVRYLKDNTRPN